MRARRARAAVALGGNLGDVLATFQRALIALAESAGDLVAVSSAYRTEALVAPQARGPAPDYWNAACLLDTELAPRDLLARLHALEALAGRRRRRRWEARPLDLDLLVYGALVVDEPDLTLPHPRLSERVFVLRPLAEIAPALPVPPGGETAGELLGRLPDPDAGIREVQPGWYVAGSRERAEWPPRCTDGPE